MPYRKEKLPDGDSKSLRVLCAEDDPYIATVLKAGLRHAGHFVECVADGADAIERIEAQPKFFDVLITDHRMPRTTGLMLVRALRDRGFGGRIIVHCSGLTARDAAAYRELGVDRLFEKPIQSVELVRIVAGYTRAEAPRRSPVLTCVAKTDRSQVDDGDNQRTA